MTSVWIGKDHLLGGFWLLVQNRGHSGSIRYMSGLDAPCPKRRRRGAESDPQCDRRPAQVVGRSRRSTLEDVYMRSKQHPKKL